MMRNCSRLLKDESGIALVTGLVLLMSLTALGIFATNVTIVNQDISASLKASKQGFYLAEAGIQHAQSLLTQNRSRTYWNTYATAQTLPLSVPSELSGIGTYTVTIQDAGGGLRRVLSTGNTSSHAEAVIEVLFRNNALSICALCTKGTLNMGGQGTIDSYDSGVGSYNVLSANSNGSIFTNGDIIGAGSAMQVHGDATAGGTVSNTSVTGTITNHASPQSFPSVADCGTYSPSTGITGGSYNSITGALTGSGSAAITLASGTYCFSSVNLSGTSTLTINANNGPVKIYLTGESVITPTNSSFAGGGIINPTHLAANLQIYSSVSSATKGITLLGVSQTYKAYMTVYAPNAHITFNGGGDFYGALVGGSFDDQNSIGPERLHYDEALSGLRGAGGAGIAILTWRQVF